MPDDFGFMQVDWESRIDFDRLRKDRVRKAQEAVAASEADTLFVFRTEDARYLTAYRHHQGPSVIIGNATAVLTAKDPPILFTMDEDHCKARMPWLGKGQVQPRANFREVAGIKEFANRLHGLVGSLEGKTIGVDIYSPSMAEGLRQAFPKSRFVDGYEILMKAKMIKTEDEIHCLKAATSMTEAAMDAAVRFLKPGVRECEVLAVAWQTMTALGSEWTQCSNIVASGPYTAPYRRITSDRVIRMGDLVIIDIGGCFNGYYGDFTRTWVCGEMDPTPEQIDLHQKCYDALFNGCAACRPGNTNAAVVEAAGEENVLSSLGHGSGTNPWEHPHFSVTSKNDPMVLQAGMVANLEPYRGKPGIGGFRLENNLVIREKGPEIYTPYPFDERLVKKVHPLDVSTGRFRRAYSR
jgi:Xaa-Pro aminopeptidase